SSVEQDDSRDQLDGGEKISSKLVVSRGDSSVMLDFVEEPLDEISLAVEHKITIALHLSVSFCRDYPRHRRARGLWWSILHAICRSLARRFFSRTGAVLVSAYDGGIDHHVLVVAIAAQQLENTLEHPALRPSAETLMDRFPGAETLR